MRLFFSLIFLTKFCNQTSFASTVLILLFDCLGFILTLFTYKSILVELTKFKVKSMKTNDKPQKVK